MPLPYPTEKDVFLPPGAEPGRQYLGEPRGSRCCRASVFGVVQFDDGAYSPICNDTRTRMSSPPVRGDKYCFRSLYLTTIEFALTPHCSFRPNSRSRHAFAPTTLRAKSYFTPTTIICLQARLKETKEFISTVCGQDLILEK